MKKVCMGGTFDVIHSGHEALLRRALEVSERVIIGLTTDSRAQKGREGENIASYSERELNLFNWFRLREAHNRVSIVPLDNDWGPGVVESSIEGIVVSKEKESVATRLNRFRTKRNMPEIEIIVVPMVEAYDGKRISSSRVRKKEISLEGLET